MSDALSVFSWWLVIQILGLAAWPLAFRWLRWLPDRGYMLAKPLGLLLVSYGLWLLATLSVVPNTPGGAAVIVILVGALSVWVYRRLRPSTANLQSPISNLQSPTSSSQSLTSIVREHRGLVIAYEALFALALVAWAIFRAHNPDLSSTEKPMEFAFFNAIGRSAAFPPHDPWLAGYAVAYYYFGYVMMSVLHQLSGVTAGTAFSLSNALWFALSAAGAFGVVANLILLSSQKAKWAAISCGACGALMLVLMGNFEAPLEVGRIQGLGTPGLWTQLDILDLNQPYTPPETGEPDWPPRFWWWWRASRVIHDYPPDAMSPQLAALLGTQPVPPSTYQELIDEFPQFSFLLGDMHPHVLALPFALLAIALALNLHQAGANGEVTSLWPDGGRLPLWWLYPLAVGGLSFLNTWDFPIYAFVLAAALALGRWRAGAFSVWDGVSNLLVLGIAGVLLYIPFYRGFTSQASGIAPNLFNGTRAVQFFIMFGPFVIVGLMFGLVLLIETIRAHRARLLPFAIRVLGGSIGLIAAASIAAAGLGLIIFSFSDRARDWFNGIVNSMESNGITVSDHVLARLSDPWVPLLLGSGLVAIVLLWRARRARSDQGQPSGSAPAPPIDFVLLLYAIGLLLTFGVEFAYIIDQFASRMNTVFKFYYQAWALWSLASAYAVYYLLRQARSGAAVRLIWAIVVLVVVGFALAYPLLAIPDKLDQGEPTLDAEQATARSAPDEYAAVEWLNQNVSGAPIILEASGEGYNPSTSRISTWTGLPTLVGWPDHEGQWRGNNDVQGQRMPQVTEIYSTTDAAQSLTLLQSYGVSYVYVGPNERRLYSPASLAKFDQMMPVVFQRGAVTIYRAPSSLAASAGP